MTKALVDANGILRYLTNDLAPHAEKFEKRLDQVKEKNLKLYLLPITIVEVVFHLKNTYKFSYPNTSKIILDFIKSSGIVTRNKDLVIRSLKVFAENKIDFVDVYLAEKAKSEKLKVLSFDKDFDKLSKTIRLSP